MPIITVSKSVYSHICSLKQGFGPLKEDSRTKEVPEGVQFWIAKDTERRLKKLHLDPDTALRMMWKLAPRES